MTALKSPEFARIAAFAAYILLLAADPYLAHWLSQFPGADARWLYAVRVAVTAAILLWFWRDYHELRGHAGAGLLQHVALATSGGVLVFALWILPYPAWAVLQGGGQGFTPVFADGSMDWGLAIIRLCGVVLVVPVMEELFFRSFLMRWLENRHFMAQDPAQVSAFAFMATAVLFAVEHQLWLAGLLAGLIYGGLYCWTRRLWVSVLAHAVTNGLLGLWVIHARAWHYW
jgi:CAAX prenyl protease-like protein